MHLIPSHLVDVCETYFISARDLYLYILLHLFFLFSEFEISVLKAIKRMQIVDLSQPDRQTDKGLYSAKPDFGV